MSNEEFNEAWRLLLIVGGLGAVGIVFALMDRISRNKKDDPRTPLERWEQRNDE